MIVCEIHVTKNFNDMNKEKNLIGCVWQYENEKLTR